MDKRANTRVKKTRVETREREDFLSLDDQYRLLEEEKKKKKGKKGYDFTKYEQKWNLRDARQEET